MEIQAIFDNFRHSVTDHYFDMHGRVGRAQFWYFVLAYFGLAIVAGIVGGILGLPLALLFSLALLLPSLGMGARRLQDTGRDGRLVWIPLIGGLVAQVYREMADASVWLMGWLPMLVFGPLLFIVKVALFIAWVALIYFWCQPGSAGDNVYGPPPPVFDPSIRVSAP
jgi:uncharacterized membrane protein YhaH (DUF805 family)